MKRITILFFAVLILLSLSACGTPEESGAPESPAVQPETSTLPVETPIAVATASTEELSLAELKTVTDALDYLDTVLPYRGDEELIPYVADLYHAGDNAFVFEQCGFCTRRGEIVTKPVFSGIRVVRSLSSDGQEAQLLYQCFLPGADSPLMFTAEGFRADERPYEDLPRPDSMIAAEMGDVDDGFYYLDGYTLITRDDGSRYAQLEPRADGRYDICRKSDGKTVAATELPPYCWPDLFSRSTVGGGRVYFTMQDGVCTTWDENFVPILRAPALGLNSSSLFEPPSDEKPASAKAEEQGERIELTGNQRYAANLSLSNYSEQCFCEFMSFDHYDAEDTSVAQLFFFAHLWAKINRNDAISYEGNFETMSLDDFWDIVEPRLVFPEELRPVEGEDYSAALGMGNFDWDRCWYENGRFYYPAADGESFNRFSLVDEAYKVNDQTYRFCFTIYELDLDIYWGRHSVPDEYYHLTAAEVVQRIANGEIRAVRTGMAVCSPIYWESSRTEMYRLAYYELSKSKE